MWLFKRSPSEGHVEAEAALKDARKNLRRIQRRDTEVKNVVDSLRDIRERNGFGEALEAILIHPQRN
jgi:hypothetical protein